MQRYDAASHAAAAVAVCNDVGPRARDDQSPDGGAGDADGRPLSRRTLLRHTSRRLRDFVGTLLLDLRTSGSVRADTAGVRLRERDYSGVLAESDLRLSGNGGGKRWNWIHQFGRVGSSHVHDRNDIVWQCVL